MAQEAKSEGDRELAELRREVIEARNLVIKTDNLLKNLHAELKMVGRRQEDFQKRQWVSSAAAYLAFVGLCVAGAILLSSARVASVGADRERLEKSVADLTAQVDKARAESSALALAQRQAAEVYKLMTTLPGDERLKGVDALVKLDMGKLTALEKQALNDRAALLRREIGAAAFERGKVAFRRNDMPETVKELGRFVAMNPDPQEMNDASFFLGVAYNQLKKHDDAVRMLRRFADGDKKSKTRDYALLLLAQSLQETGQIDKAADTARAGLAEYPDSQFAPQFRGRLASIKRLQAGPAPDAGAPAAAAATPAGATKPPAPPSPAAAPAPAPGPAPAAH